MILVEYFNGHARRSPTFVRPLYDSAETRFSYLGGEEHELTVTLALEATDAVGTSRARIVTSRGKRCTTGVGEAGNIEACGSTYQRLRLHPNIARRAVGAKRGTINWPRGTTCRRE